jgi:CheY-like chemotaxis protein
MTQYQEGSVEKNILIVDDDPDTCRLLEAIFSQQGYRTGVVYSGEEAVRWVETSTPDLVVLDVMMPGMDGWETFREMRDRTETPVMFLSALGAGENAAGALHLGAGDYMSKPFHPAELLARVESLLGRCKPDENGSQPNRQRWERQPLVTVIIPTLNEAENLPHILPYLPYEMIDEVVLVDGRSTDGTVDVARQLLPSIKVILETRLGKGAAIRRGFAAASGDIVITMDGDGSMNPAEIPLFIGALLSGADYVKGTRFVHGSGTLDMPVYRRLGNMALVWTANLLFGTRYTDITYGYNATWRHHAHALALEIDGWACEIISNIRAACCGLRVVEVPCLERERIAGEAKLHAFSAGWVILKAMLRERLLWSLVRLTGKPAPGRSRSDRDIPPRWQIRERIE